MRYLKEEDFKGQSIRLLPRWISNGHWGLRRDQIVGGSLFTKEVCTAVFPDPDDEAHAPDATDLRASEAKRQQLLQTARAKGIL
jgi:hypothetical protein